MSKVLKKGVVGYKHWFKRQRYPIRLSNDCQSSQICLGCFNMAHRSGRMLFASRFEKCKHTRDCFQLTAAVPAMCFCCSSTPHRNNGTLSCYLSSSNLDVVKLRH